MHLDAPKHWWTIGLPATLSSSTSHGRPEDIGRRYQANLHSGFPCPVIWSSSCGWLKTVTNDPTWPYTVRMSWNGSNRWRSYQDKHHHVQHLRPWRIHCSVEHLLEVCLGHALSIEGSRQTGLKDLDKTKLLHAGRWLNKAVTEAGLCSATVLVVQVKTPQITVWTRLNV